MIANHDQRVAGEDRRRAHAVQVGKGPQRTFPALLSVQTIRSKPEVSEEDVHVLAVGDRAGRGRIVQLVENLLAIGQDLAPPENLTGTAMEAQSLEVIAFRGGQKDAVAGENRRGTSARQGRFPDDILIWAELDRELRLFGDARAIWPAKLGPVGGGA